MLYKSILNRVSYCHYGILVTSCTSSCVVCAYVRSHGLGLVIGFYRITWRPPAVPALHERCTIDYRRCQARPSQLAISSPVSGFRAHSVTAATIADQSPVSIGCHTTVIVLFHKAVAFTCTGSVHPPCSRHHGPKVFNTRKSHTYVYNVPWSWR